MLRGQVPHTIHCYIKHSHTKKKIVEKERQQKKAKYASIKQRKAKACTKLEAQVSSSYIIIYKVGR